MRKLMALALLAVGACSTTVTEEERRWKNIEGHEVFIATDYGTTVHEVDNCPGLAKAKTVKKGRVKDARIVDEQGLYASAPGVRADLCPTCVK
jgi:hypothetical protein